MPVSSRSLLPLLLALLPACASSGEEEAQRELQAKVSTAVAPPIRELGGTAYEAASRTPLPPSSAEEHQALHNVFELSENIVAGSEPEGEEAFRILADKGIRTILSVDGKVPDAELASKYGIKYVHVPIQYKGITDGEVDEIVKTFREQEGPFYVHCFHGKHRGPAAAALGRLVLDGIERETALAEMRQYCGTSGSYEGLYRTVAQADLPTPEESAALDWDFPAAKPLDGIGGAMVSIGRPFDELKALAKRGWEPDPTHPDLNPVNEAAKLADLFERTRDLPALALELDEFQGWMRDSVPKAMALHEALQGRARGTATLDDVQAAYDAVADSCSACHQAYRN